MFRTIAIAAASLMLAASPGYAAKPCRDAHGKFVKCADKAAPPVARCKDAKGKFAKCGTPGAMPATVHTTTTKSTSTKSTMKASGSTPKK